MSKRLQVLIPEALERRIDKEAQRRRLTKSDLVREAMESYLRGPRPSKEDPVTRLARLDGPSADIDQMLAEIEAGRR